MTLETHRRSKERDEKARTLLERIDHYSLEVANGSHESVTYLLDSLVPSGPDEGPEIPVTFEALRSLTPRERLAINIAHDFCSDFNREFGWNSGAGSLLDWENNYLKKFFLNLGKTVQGLLHHPEGQFGHNVVESMIQTNEAYYNWAKEQLTKKRA